MGLYKRKDSRFWRMGYTAKGGQRCESTKTSSKALAKKIWKKREGEIALGRFQIGWPGERMTFGELSEAFFRSHSSTLSPKSQMNHQMFLKNLRAYFGDSTLTEIDERSVVEYCNHRHRQPLKRDARRTLKGATVNRELACLHCVFQFALKRKYIGEKAGVSYFPIYNLRHVFCTRLSWVAPDAVVQRAMRHSSPETKRHYQLGMVDQVREGIEQANKKAYQGRNLLRFYYGSSTAEKEATEGSVSS